MKKLHFLFLGVCGVGTMWAQTPAPSPTPPAGALLKRAPDFSAWEITAASPDAPADVPSPAKTKRPHPKAAPGSDRVTTVTKTGDVVFVETKDKGGVKSQEWHKGACQVTIRPEWQAPLISMGGNPTDMAHTDYSTSDFPDLRWISKKNYKGVSQKNGHNCLTFEDRLLTNPDGREMVLSERSKPADPAATLEELAQAIPVSAYVDSDSRLPVSVSRGTETLDYQFKEPPKGMQVLPAGLQALIDTRQAELAAKTHAPAAP